jgi:hypothetical protein
MLDEILSEASYSTYDFRTTACPDDPQSPMFDEWLPYYRFKWAVASILQPDSIVEVGVRYGYSALAFLNAWPQATYHGFDNDSNDWGGTIGASAWLLDHSEGLDVSLTIADIMETNDLPDCSLAHLDGPQDQAGWAHQIHLALDAANYILIDGAFHTPTSASIIQSELVAVRDRLSWWAWTDDSYGQVLVEVADA